MATASAAATASALPLTHPRANRRHVAGRLKGAEGAARSAGKPYSGAAP
ncbi:MAG: hypothetical protein QM756_17715 [Polyangiaceae bacterium]